MSYQFNSIVNKNEAAALKEMIFNRVRERAKDMTENTQSEVMDMARDSFISENNPFSKIIENNENNNIQQQKVNKVTESEHNSVESNKQEDIGFEIKEPKLIQNKIINQQLTAAEISTNMRDAREGLSNKKSFMGALNFLNSQAAVSLIRTRADKFEIVV